MPVVHSILQHISPRYRLGLSIRRPMINSSSYSCVSTIWFARIYTSSLLKSLTNIMHSSNRNAQIACNGLKGQFHSNSLPNHSVSQVCRVGRLPSWRARHIELPGRAISVEFEFTQSAMCARTKFTHNTQNSNARAIDCNSGQNLSKSSFAYHVKEPFY